MNAPDRILGLTAEQKAVRFEGVGASETAAALGLSRYQTQAELWAIKTRRVAPPDDEAIFRLGHIVEPFILDEWARDHAHLAPALMPHPPMLRRGRMLANLDAMAALELPTQSVIVVEAKQRGSRDGFGEAGSSDVPDEIMLQVTQQMSLAGLAVAHVPVLFVRPPIVTYEVSFDPELAEMIEAGVERFWWHVEHDTPPPVDPNSHQAMEALRLLYRGTSGERVNASPDLEAWRKVYEESLTHRDRYRDAAEAAKCHMLAFMKDATELAFSDGQMLRRKLVKRRGYAVADTEFVDARFVKTKGE
jgi:predicted phage-related endonuclease